MEELRGKVVVLDFWTYSCINCLRTLPYLERWDEAYRDKGLVLVGVHTPEFAFERERVERRGRRRRGSGVEYPVALDSEVRHVERVGQPLLAGEVLRRPGRATSATRTSARATTRRASA